MSELRRLFFLDIGLNLLTNTEFLARLTALLILYLDDNLLSDTGPIKGAGSDGQSGPPGSVAPVLGPLLIWSISSSSKWLSIRS